MTNTTTIRARGLKAVAAVAAVCVLGSVVCQGVTEGTEVSVRRIGVIRHLVQSRFARDGLAAGTFGVTKGVLVDFAKAEPSCPLGVTLADLVTEEDCKQAARQMTRELVEKKFPDLQPEALEAEAAKKYPVYAEGSIVEVEFQLNPARRERIRGVYNGRTPNSIMVGRRQIYLPDMAAVEGNAGQILMFDAQRSGELRKQYTEERIRAYEEAREKYTETVRVVAKRERYLLGARQNEARGYVFMDGTWWSVRNLVPKVVEAERARLLAEQKQSAEQQAMAMQHEAAVLVTAELAATELGSSTLHVDPAAELAALTAQVEAERKLAAVAEEEARKKAEAEAAAEEARKKEEEARAAQQVAVAPVAPVPTPEESGLPWTFIAIIGVFVLGTGAAVVYSVSRSRSRDPARFFQGKGRQHRNFWAMAEADPDGFKYVAYRFPTMDSARSALLNLSFISEAPGGQLKCHRDILFGFYPHQDKVVCFVGGTDLHYALWREASAVLPEIPGAEYFRVSTAPGVKLEIPDIEQLLSDENLKVEHVENREGEGDDYSQYYVYRAPDKQNALEFLKRARVSEAGVHVIVQTPEGTWGKDENGIYQE